MNRSSSDELVTLAVGIVVVVGLGYALYRPRVQRSSTYQATVVPLANIMDVGFIVLAPTVVFLAGVTAPLAMAGICLLALATGMVIAHNIRRFEPLEGSGDRLELLERAGQWSLLAASIVNIAYYALLLITLVLWPLDIYTEGQLQVWGTAFLAGLAVVGAFGGMGWLNTQGERTTAFNLAAIAGVVACFVVFNVQEWLGGRWAIPDSAVSLNSDEIRKLVGLFALVQGFEASRYIGARFGREQRVSTMRLSQWISSLVFVALLAAVLILFVGVDVPDDGTGIFVVSDRVGSWLPWFVLLAAIGSQTSAIINATTSRSEMLVAARVPRRVSFLLILGPATLIFLLVDVNMAVALASRVFAVYFAIQALIAAALARRARRLGTAVGSSAVLIAMLGVAIFGLPS